MLIGWAIIAVASTIVAVTIATGRFVIDDTALPQGFVSMSMLGTSGMVLRARGWSRIGTSAEIFSQFTLASVLAALVSVILVSTNLPLQDDALEGIDRHLFGFDWHLVINVSQNCPDLMTFLSYSYASLNWQPGVLLGSLFVLGRHEVANRFCAVWVIVLAISVVILPLVPAVGGYLHNHVMQSQTHVLVPAAWRHIAVLGPARDGTLRALNANTIEGIITFPSFHAAAAVLLTWGFWQIRFVRWPALALNLAMLASTPFIGGHYLVDVATGSIIAIVTISVFTTRRAGIAVKARSGHPPTCPVEQNPIPRPDVVDAV